MFSKWLNDNQEELEVENIEREIDIDNEEFECALIGCERCEAEYSESDGHECVELEKEPDDSEDADPYGCETIYCEPTCPKCGRDEDRCDGECDKPEEPEPLEEEFEPSADFCRIHKIENCDCKNERKLE